MYIAMVVRVRCVGGCVHSNGSTLEVCGGCVHNHRSALEVCGGDVYKALIYCLPVLPHCRLQ